METSDWIEAQRLIESVAQIKSEIDGLFTCSPDVVVEKSNEIIAKLNKCNSDLTNQIFSFDLYAPIA